MSKYLRTFPADIEKKGILFFFAVSSSKESSSHTQKKRYSGSSFKKLYIESRGNICHPVLPPVNAIFFVMIGTIILLFEVGALWRNWLFLQLYLKQGNIFQRLRLRFQQSFLILYQMANELMLWPLQDT